MSLLVVSMNLYINIVVSAASISETLPLTVMILSLYFLLAAAIVLFKFPYKINSIYCKCGFPVFCICKFFGSYIPINTRSNHRQYETRL